MTLADLMNLEEISDYKIWWYGASIADDYIDDNGLIKDTADDIKNGDDNQIVLILSGINKYKCRYRCAIRLIKTEKENTYNWEKVHIKLDEYANRIVFKRNKGFSFYNSIKTAKDFVVDEIWSEKSDRMIEAFTTYDEVDLSFDELKEVIDNHYPDYYNALSVVKGIYMIIDGNTGKQYIGSAYGEDAIWGRWTSYANTYHGDNTELKDLYNKYKEPYFKKFKYIILQILPFNISDREIIERENFYKERFMTRAFGLNSN